MKPREAGDAEQTALWSPHSGRGQRCLWLTRTREAQRVPAAGLEAARARASGPEGPATPRLLRSAHAPLCRLGLSPWTFIYFFFPCKTKRATLLFVPFLSKINPLAASGKERPAGLTALVQRCLFLTPHCGRGQETTGPTTVSGPRGGGAGDARAPAGVCMQTTVPVLTASQTRTS